MLKDSTVRVAGFLMWRLNCQYEECFPGRKTIADELGLSLRTVEDCLRQLKDRGWLKYTPRFREDGSQTTSSYRFMWERADDDTESYVHRDRDRKQQPDESCEAGTETSAAPPTAKPAGIIREDLTRESNQGFSQVSTPAATKPGGEGEAKGSRPTPKAGRTGSPSRTGDQTTDAIWQKQLPELIEAHNVARRSLGERPESGGQLRGRTGKLIKTHGAPCVWKAFDTTIKAQPGGCPFDYATKLLAEQNSEEDRARALLYAPIEYR